MTSRTNPMTIADAKVELVARAIERARVERRFSNEDLARAAITALEASPNSRTEAIQLVDYVVEMARQYEVAISRVPDALGNAGERLEQAKRELLAAMQSARPIDRESEGASPMATGLDPKGDGPPVQDDD